jgi:hypothetical protein
MEMKSLIISTIHNLQGFPETFLLDTYEPYMRVVSIFVNS